MAGSIGRASVGQGSDGPAAAERPDPWSVAASVLDPELPVLTIADLGVLRDVRLDTDGAVHVTITPTYSGCPAMEAIRDDIESALRGHGYRDVTTRTALSPAWTTDWITDRGRQALREHGIAPPEPRHQPGPAQHRQTSGSPGLRRDPVRLELTVRCPRCGSTDTRLVSRFGSTACKALRVCTACLEPFDHIKAI